MAAAVVKVEAVAVVIVVVAGVSATWTLAEDRGRWPPETSRGRLAEKTHC